MVFKKKLYNTVPTVDLGGKFTVGPWDTSGNIQFHFLKK